MFIRRRYIWKKLTRIQSEEWLYFHSGEAQATVFTGNSNSRTFNFKAGDTAVFPDNAGTLSSPSLSAPRTR
jgi:oxalate decarboxylase/phosphoglucose isomerase-like protein (cupin superfamily)